MIIIDKNSEKIIFLVKPMTLQILIKIHSKIIVNLADFFYFPYLHLNEMNFFVKITLPANLTLIFFIKSQT